MIASLLWLLSQFVDGNVRGVASVVRGSSRSAIVCAEAATRARLALPAGLNYPHLFFGDVNVDDVEWARSVPSVPTIAHALRHVFEVEGWDAVLFVDPAVLMVRDFGTQDPLESARRGYVGAERDATLLAARADLALRIGEILGRRAPVALYDVAVFAATPSHFAGLGSDQLDALAAVDDDRRLVDAIIVATLVGDAPTFDLKATYADLAANLLVREGEPSPLGRQQSKDLLLDTLRGARRDRLRPQTALMVKAAANHADTFRDDLLDLGMWPAWHANHTLALPHVLLLQLIEKFGVVCDENIVIDSLVLLPRFCCCHLNTNADPLRKARDLEDAITLVAPVALGGGASPTARLAATFPAYAAALRLRARGGCDFPQEPQHSAALCAPTLRPCEAALAAHDCPR